MLETRYSSNSSLKASRELASRLQHREAKCSRYERAYLKAESVSTALTLEELEDTGKSRLAAA